MENKDKEKTQHSWLKRMQKSMVFRNIIMFTIPISFAVLIILLYRLSETVDSLSHSLIKRTTGTTERELKDFFSPVVQNLYVARQWGSASTFDQMDVRELNRRFIPMLKNYPQVSSMMIANTEGIEYMLLELDSSWMNRMIYLTDSGRSIMRQEWLYTDKLEGRLLRQWPQEKPYDPRKRPWFINAMESPDKGKASWTEPYTFFTTKEPGITVSLSWPVGDGGLQYVVGFDILLRDVSVFTTDLSISKNGMAFILTEDLRVLGLPTDDKYVDPELVKAHVLKDYDAISSGPLTEAIRHWQSMDEGRFKPFLFEYDGEKWWGGLTEFSLGNEKLYIGVAVPEKDFLEEMNRTRVVIIAGFLLVLVLTLLVIRSYNQKRKANVLLAKQKEEIERQRDKITEQNKEITDSIRYAKGIQQSALPPEKLVKEILPESFVLFKPKDIVSGDFYWCTQRKGKTVVVAADCTGHGVPGAFMSMLGMTFLNEIVNKDLVLSPAQILNKLREEIIRILRQTGQSGTSKDGMDIALYTIDQDWKSLRFAGANNPLYHVRDGQTTVYKADKMPIGFYHSEQMPGFSEETVELQTGDCLYTFSDGFADQFGGPKGKKFKYRPFKELLTENHSQSMETQKAMLDKAIEDWKAWPDGDAPHHEQMDDIVVFGVRVHG